MRNRIRVWYAWIAAAAAGCMVWLANIGDASLHGMIGGLSASRLLMIGGLLVFAAAAAAGAAGLLDRGRFSSEAFLRKKSVRICAGAGAFLSYALLVLMGFVLSEKILPYYQRLQPVLVFFLFFFGSSFLLSMRLSFERKSFSKEELRKTVKVGLIYLSVAAALYLMIRLTGIGLVPDEMDWQPTGMTIQYWEIAFSLGAAVLCSFLIEKLSGKIGKTAAAVAGFLLIWGIAAGLWVSIPTMEVLDHSYFMEITAPNYLPYPASDAASYGIWSESILAGLGFKSAIATRQFLITLLAFFQTLTDRDVLKTIDCMTVLLALIPACLFLLGIRLHSTGAGFLAAFLAIFREYNTILLAPHFMVSSSKMWLSDLPALLCLIAVVSACVSWYQKPRSVWRIILAGCLMGFCVTVRSQFIVLTVFPVFFFLIRNGLKLKEKLRFSLLFLIPVVLIIAPWAIRSRIITGQFILDDPGVHSTELARRYSDDVTNQVTRAEGESDADYAARNQNHMIDFFLEKPGYVLKFIMSHFTANEIYSLCVLPFGTDPSLTIRDVTNTDFHDVAGRLTDLKNLPMLAVFLILIALGMAAAWRRCGWAGLLPFMMCSLYLGSTSAARYSGWRFALPGDWHFYFYFALGVMELGHLLLQWFGSADGVRISAPLLDTGKMPHRRGISVVLLAVFLALGIAPAVVQLLPDRIEQHSSEENLAQLRTLSENYPKAGEKLEAFLSDDSMEAVSGRDLYPRFFYENQGLASGHPWPSYMARPFARLGFILLNHENENVVIPLAEEPGVIPHGKDVIVLGHHDPDGLFLGEAIVFLPDDENGVPRVLVGVN